MPYDRSSFVTRTAQEDIAFDFMVDADAYVADKLFSPKPLDKAEKKITQFDNSKLRRLVPEFQPRVPFAEGVAGSLAWFDADPSRRVVSAAANDSIERVLAAWGRAWEGLAGNGLPR